jgi:hypothetical protein
LEVSSAQVLQEQVQEPARRPTGQEEE